MKQRHRRKYIQKKQNTDLMAFLIKTRESRYNGLPIRPPLVPFIRSYRLGIFPNLFQVQEKRYGLDPFLR